MTDQLGPDFEERLQAELERFRPPTPLPQTARFRGPQPGYRPFGGMKLALAMAGALAVLTVVAASAATGTDPASWPQRAVTTVESVTHAGEASSSPSPEHQTQSNVPAQGQPSKTAKPDQKSPVQPRGSRTEPKESPEPTDGSHNEPKQSPEPSPTQPNDHHESPSPDLRSQSLSWLAPDTEKWRSDIGRTGRYQ